MAANQPPRPYLSNGQILQSPPFTARARNFVNETYAFLGLYLTTLFSLDAYSAAENSPYNLRNRNEASAGRVTRPLPSGSGGGGGGGDPGTGGSGSGSKKLGTVDDIRGPECKSCG